MIEIKLYKKGDWYKIEDSVEPFMPVYTDFDYIAAKGIAVTATDNDKVMAVGGVTFINDKEGTVWVKVSKACAKRPIMWARFIKNTFKIMTESVGDIEIYTYILDNFCKGEKLARIIKMKRCDITREHNGNIYNKYKVVL